MVYVVIVRIVSVKLLKNIRFSNNENVKIAASHSSVLSGRHLPGSNGLPKFCVCGPQTLRRRKRRRRSGPEVSCGGDRVYAHFTSGVDAPVIDAKSMRCGRCGFEG